MGRTGDWGGRRLAEAIWKNRLPERPTESLARADSGLKRGALVTWLLQVTGAGTQLSHIDLPDRHVGRKSSPT